MRDNVNVDENSALRMIGKRIKLARVESEMNQRALADLLHVSQNTVSLYESGRIEIGALMLRRISDVLNKPVDYFFAPFESVGASASGLHQTAARSKPPPKKAPGGKRDAA